MIFSTNKTPTEDTEQKISAAQTQMLARFIIGILDETWKLIGKWFLATPIGKEYVPRLNLAGQTALAELKKHFGESNLMSKLRNSVAFHHPDEGDMDAGFEAAANDRNWDNDWNWYLSRATFNSFYFASDFVILHSILNTIGETDLIEAQKRIMAEVNKVSDHMVNFIMDLSAAFWVKHFGNEMKGEVAARVTGAPNVLEFWLPFYVEITAEQQAHA